MPRVPVMPRLPAKGRTALVWGARLALAAVFLGAAVPKLGDPVAFARDIDHYRLVPAPLLGPLAVGLPLLEALIGVALITGVHAQGAALVALVMLLSFAGGMVQALARGIDLDCGCFGSALAARVSGFTVARNLGLAALCLPVLFLRPGAVNARPEDSSAPPGA